MLTPVEKLIFSTYALRERILKGPLTDSYPNSSLDTLLLLVVSMFLTAAYIYLPNHVVTIFHHIWYYWAGEPFTASAASSAGAVLNKLPLDRLKQHPVVGETAKIVAETTAKRLSEL